MNDSDDHRPGGGRQAGITTMLLLALLSAGKVAVADVEFVVTSVEEPLRENILHHNESFVLGRSGALSENELDEIVLKSVERSRLALRPFGYYHAVVEGSHRPAGDGNTIVQIDVKPGPGMRIESLGVELAGAGSRQRALRRWRDEWPMPEGSLLNQVTWEAQKQQGLERANALGYLAASYSEHALELNLDSNTATARLILDTGPRYVFGDVEFGEHVLQPGIVEYIPRFENGDPYSAELLDDFRLDLWRTGYFTAVEVSETRRPDADPPAVDLKVELETTTRNSYQGELGYGTDTGVRLQANWGRHPLSSRGDRMDISAGWQDYNNEFAIRGTYRMPLRHRAREYWTVDATFKFENQDLEIKRSDEDENFITLANGNVDDRHVKAGWLKVFNASEGFKQTFLTPFVQYLNSDRRFSPVEPDGIQPNFAEDPNLQPLLRGIDNALSVGVDLDIVSVVGKAFQTRGYHDRAWIFATDSALGSDVDFLQAYVSTRRSYLKGTRWKFILRAELGYTDADVREFSVDVDGDPIELSVTQLPNFYRFKAGGSTSVRGYSFEQLSNNNIGSNNIFTASAETEFRFSERWSGAVFADIGNAFNDWSNPQLKLGLGVGIRWYSIAGPVRLDIAQATGFTNRPWRVHLTVGTPLL